MRFLWLLPIAAVIGLDHLTKYLISSNMQLEEIRTIIPGILDFHYITNDGAAMGILDDYRWIFMSVSTIAILAVLVFMFVYYEKYYSPLLYASLSMIVGGGIGNMIDRIAWVEVIDFIDIKFIPFWKWIFNVADIFVCVGCGLAMFYIIRVDISESRKNKTGDHSSEN